MPDSVAELPETLPNQGQMRRKTISRQEAEAIAKLVSTRRMTETEACNSLDIPTKSWFNWKYKVKNSQKWGDIVTRNRAISINARFEEIEASAAGIGLKFRDWRASAHLLTIIDPARYSVNRPVESAPAQVNVSVSVLVNQLYDQYTAKPALVQAEAKGLACGVDHTISSGSGQKQLTCTPQSEQAVESKPSVT